MSELLDLLRGRRKLDLISRYPFTPDPMFNQVLRQIELEQLGIVKRPVSGAQGAEIMLTPPPEGVLKGESVPRENEKDEINELIAKARERRIKSLEKQDRLKKEVEE